MKQAFSKEVIGSAVFGATGLAFLYRAAFGIDRNVLDLVLWNLGCGFGGLSLAAQPQLLFARIELNRLRLQGSGRRGLATYLDFFGWFR